MALTRKAAQKIFDEFFGTPRTRKSGAKLDKMWNSVVPYANKYPDLYLETLKKYSINKEEEDLDGGREVQ